MLICGFIFCYFADWKRYQSDIPGDCSFLLTVQMKAASRSSVLARFLGDFRYPEAETYKPPETSIEITLPPKDTAVKSVKVG